MNVHHRPTIKHVKFTRRKVKILPSTFDLLVDFPGALAGSSSPEYTAQSA